MSTSNYSLVEFKENVSHLPLPETFTFPFNYTPNPLALQASKELQEYLATQIEWVHDFSIGKMFGVLVVLTKEGNLGYLTAFSGKLAEKSILPPFVPPVYDRLTTDGFFIEEEEELNILNRKVKDLLSNSQYRDLTKQLEDSKTLSIQELSDGRKGIKAAKKVRDKKRLEAEKDLPQKEYDILCQRLIKESQDYQFNYKRLAKKWKQEIEELQKEIEGYEVEIHKLKKERKEKSARLQVNLFNQYQFLTIHKEPKGLFEIFKPTIHDIPPSGAGDCAAPKLLQHAFLNDLKPICMAEFWWGATPKQEILKHGHFYPSCKGKCEPILGHMLKGMTLDKNPISEIDLATLDIQILFEDDHIAIINKPSGLLSIPGKRQNDSVATRMKNKYPHATGPLVVHRLDMSTSGLMLIAKDKDTHKHLQSQFAKRTIKKQYVAVLEGLIKEDKGTIDLPLRVDIDNRPSQIVCYEHGKSARTHWEKIKEDNGKTWIHFFPVTGRTHQLRVHAAHASGLNTPIVGDDLYGTKADRLLLHAEQFEFVHPSTEKILLFQVNPDF